MVSGCIDRAVVYVSFVDPRRFDDASLRIYSSRCIYMTGCTKGVRAITAMTHSVV